MYINWTESFERDIVNVLSFCIYDFFSKVFCVLFTLIMYPFHQQNKVLSVFTILAQDWHSMPSLLFTQIWLLITVCYLHVLQGQVLIEVKIIQNES